MLTPDEIARFTELYTNPNVTIEDICRIFGYAPGSIYRMGYELGLKRPKGIKGTQLNLKQIRTYCESLSSQLPPLQRSISPLPYVPAPYDIELILLLSDEHAGRMTRSTNAVVFGNRMIELSHRVVRDSKRIAKWAPVNKLSIFHLGDTVTGERVGLNVTLEELEHTILTQCYGIAIPRLVRFTEYLLQNMFATIDIYAVPGNHGVVTRPQVSKGANWDNVVNLGWQAQMSKYIEVTFDVATVDWYNFATIKKTDWLLVHGDQFRGSCNYSGIANAIKDWHQSMPEHFDYVAMGHFHHLCKIREIFMNGTLLTDDDWSREVVKRDAECCQLLIAVSDKGIEDIIPIWLDDVREDYSYA